MDPADAGPSSKHDAGASPVSGDFPSDRADDSETSAESVDHRACASFDDVLPDLASMRASGLRGPRGARATDFFRDVWGDAPMRWRVRPETLRSLRAGFRNGDVARLIRRDCRDAANDAYDEEDAQEMTDRTRPPLRHTLNLPFCFAPGAHALRNAILRVAYDAPELAEDLLEDEDETRRKKPFTQKEKHRSPSSSARLRFANDVEVGVYASPEGGVEAAWHYDANHNVTVQLYGSKTWFVTPGEKTRGGDGDANAGRGLADAPRNGGEARDVFDASAISTFELAAGDAIYVPPGAWHRVVPRSAEASSSVATEESSDRTPLQSTETENGRRRGGGVRDAVCLSVDVRVANVPRARWACESAFHAMTSYRGASCPRAAMDGARALGDDAPERGGVATQARVNREAASLLEDDARFWYPPRLAPYQPEISDGLDLRASLGFLADAFSAKKAWRHEMERTGRYAENARATWHPMVAARVVAEDEEEKHETDATDATDEDLRRLPEEEAFVLDLRAVSGLTQMEYARLGIVLPGCVRRDVERLVDARIVHASASKTLANDGVRLSRVAPSLFRREENDDGARRAAEDLLDVLTWCRVLRLTGPEPEEKGGDEGRASAKRQKAR